MKAKIIKKKGPNDGPYESIIPNKLKIENKQIITWHENGRRNFPNIKVYDIIKGLELKENKKQNIRLYYNCYETEEIINSSTSY